MSTRPLCDQCRLPKLPDDKAPEIDEDAVRVGQVVNGREYLGHSCWCHLNRMEHSLEDERTR